MIYYSLINKEYYNNLTEFFYKIWKKYYKIQIIFKYIKVIKNIFYNNKCY